METKVCRVCRIEKTVHSFKGNGLSLDGRDHKCMACRRPDRRSTRKLRDGVLGRRCTKCRTWKPLPEFPVDRQKPDRRAYACKSCWRARSRWIWKSDPRAWAARNLASYYRHRFARLASVCNLRARKIGAIGTISGLELERLLLQYGFRCQSCGKGEPETRISMDHIVPLHRGGPNAINNIQPLCLKCNSSKALRTIDYRHPGLPAPAPDIGSAA